jgi:hypothetical protein
MVQGPVFIHLPEGIPGVVQGPVFIHQPEGLTTAPQGPSFTHTTEATVVQRNALAREGDAYKSFEETVDELVQDRITGTVVSRVLWGDTIATVITIGNGAGNADISLRAGAAQDLTLGARGVTLPYNEAGELTPDSGASLIGAINAALSAAADPSTIVPFGGNLASANDYSRINGDADGTCVTVLGPTNETRVPLTGTISTVAMRVTTTGGTLEFYLNGAATGTTFVATAGTVNPGLAVTAGDRLALRYTGTGAAPGISNFMVMID